MKILRLFLIFFFLFIFPHLIQAQQQDAVLVNQQEANSLEDAAMPQESKLQDAPVLQNVVFPLKFVRPQIVADKVRELMGSTAGGVVVNDNNHQLEVSAPAELIEKIRALIASIDQERDIQFDVKVVQVNLNEEHLTGINWSAIVSDYKNFVANEENRKYSAGTVSVEDLPVLLEALETVGQTKVYPVQSTRVSGSQEVDLRLKAFDRLVSVIVAPIDPKTDLSAQPQDRYTARFLLSPTASGDDLVDLGVISPDGTSINLNIKKDTVAIFGGIFTQTKSESTKKFPFLGDVPLLGIVFRDQSKVFQRLENIIIVTPRVTPPLTQP